MNDDQKKIARLRAENSALQVIIAGRNRVMRKHGKKINELKTEISMLVKMLSNQNKSE